MALAGLLNSPLIVGHIGQHYIHRLNPVAFSLWEVELHWHWLFYLIGFAWVFYMGQKLIGAGHGKISKSHFIQMCWGSWIALFLGSRIFYIAFYYPEYFIQHPSMIVKIWMGGMSFHGALLGIILTAYLQAYYLKISLIHFTDLLATLVPLGLMLGRVGNFINGELVGKATNLPWGIIFPQTLDFIPRHPSQLYAAVVEGLLLFVLLYSQKKYLSFKGHQSLLFLFGYGLGRFIVGFFRAPDPQLGLVWGPLSLGQMLCILMILGALYLELCYRPLRQRLKNLQ